MQAIPRLYPFLQRDFVGRPVVWGNHCRGGPFDHDSSVVDTDRVDAGGSTLDSSVVAAAVVYGVLPIVTSWPAAGRPASGQGNAAGRVGAACRAPRFRMAGWLRPAPPAAAGGIAKNRPLERSGATLVVPWGCRRRRCAPYCAAYR